MGGKNTISLWDSATRQLHGPFDGPATSANAIAWSADGRTLVSGGNDQTIKLWSVEKRKLIRSLEGHTGTVNSVVLSAQGDLIGSRSTDDTVRVWRYDNGDCLCIIKETGKKLQQRTYGYDNDRHAWPAELAFHPRLPLIATIGSDPGTPDANRDCVIHIWEIDHAALHVQRPKESVAYTSAKIVLVGDSGVGKTGLGWKLAHGDFREHSSTHGQQFWLLNQLCRIRQDGTQCEAVLWDLAGQPDYRLIHALFLDDADMALVVFDCTRNDDPMSGVEFWLKQLKAGNGVQGKSPTLLIAARSDRGDPRLTRDEIESFCNVRGIADYVGTSAKDDVGIEELLQKMGRLISWEDKPATVTTETFKRIKDFVLGLKEDGRAHDIILTPANLRTQLEKAWQAGKSTALTGTTSSLAPNRHDTRGKNDSEWVFTDAEMLTAVGHLANHGFVTKLKTSKGEPRILLTPELLNNLAASFVLEARRNLKGLGSLEERRLLSGGYKFMELESLNKDEQAILLDSATVLFLEHNVCFRETDLIGNTYLVFPELINLKRPLQQDTDSIEDGVAYTVSGAVENVYASLVVLMGYTQTFTRTNQWQNQARYEVGNGQVCGFRLEEERAGELDFVLYFGVDAAGPARMLFQSLFENFLARRNLTVRRFEPVSCANEHPLNRAVVRQRIAAGTNFAFCSECGERVRLPRIDEPIHLTKKQVADVEANRQAADKRSRFEQILFLLKTYVTDQKLRAPQCFISYAWGNAEQERWIEKSLATDLRKAGIIVVLDRWENSRIGASVPRFVERVGSSDRVIVVGTPLYRKKYDNDEPMRGFVSAAEGDLIGTRMIGTEAQKETVLPILLEGTAETAFPHLLQGRVYGDFRNVKNYFDAALELLLSLYEIKPHEQVVVQLRDLIGG